MKLLMHSCCVPCSTYPIKLLRAQDIDITSMWFNPNIHPYMEYKNRYESYKKLMEIEKIPTIEIDNYGLIDFTRAVYNHEYERCRTCYEMRFDVIAKTAKEKGFDAFTSSLFVSPYQKHELLKTVAEEKAKEHGIEFLYIDFREGFKEGQEIAREMGLYMQKYCGCVYSEAERYKDENATEVKLKNTYEIVKIKQEKEQYMPLLLEADPSVELVESYLKNGDLYALKLDGNVVSVAVVAKLDDSTCELKNVATKEEYRNMGYAKRLIKYLFSIYKQKYAKMIVGTSENNIPFYVKSGFDTYEKTVKNFFVDNYKEEVWDNGLHCMDMYYYGKKLKGK